jgi:tetratricopeptide (TPR) repeat protein
MFKWIILAALVLLAAGCNQPIKKEPTQKEAAVQKWSQARASVMYGLAKEQFQNGNFDKARLTVNDALKLDPKSAAVRILSARLAIEQGQLELADAELKLAREADPKNAEAEYYAGVVYQRWQRPMQAYDCYQSAAAKAPSELAYVMASAEMLVSLDRQADALALLQEKTSSFENNATLRDAIGQLLVQRGRYDEAIETLRRATVLANDDQQIHEHLGMALFYAKQYRESGEVLARLVKDGSYASRADIFTALGECQSRIGRTRDARASFETASRLAPGNGGVWLSLGRISLEMKDTDRAEIALRKAIGLEPGNAEAHLLMGYARLRQNRLNEALAAFRKASAIDSTDTVSLCMVGYTLEKMGKSEEAIQYFGQALKVKPDDDFASRLLAGADARE